MSDEPPVHVNCKCSPLPIEPRVRIVLVQKTGVDVDDAGARVLWRLVAVETDGTVDDALAAAAREVDWVPQDFLEQQHWPWAIFQRRGDAWAMKLCSETWASAVKGV